MLLKFRERIIVEEWWSSELKGDCVGVATYFEHRSFQDGLEIKSMIYMVLGK